MKSVIEPPALFIGHLPFDGQRHCQSVNLCVVPMTKPTL